MTTRNKMIALATPLAIFAFATGQQIWPPDPMSSTPTAAQLPFFIVLGLFEAVSFGLGIAFLVFGWPLVQKSASNSDLLTKAAFLSIAWYLINWWPHDHLHAHIGMNLQSLLYLEYGFHVTMIIAGAILARFFFTRILKAK
jgi:hypothetical protein